MAQAMTSTPICLNWRTAWRRGAVRERGGWLQIQFAGGAIGWVQKDAVLVDE